MSKKRSVHTGSIYDEGNEGEDLMQQKEWKRNRDENDIENENGDEIKNENENITNVKQKQKWNLEQKLMLLTKSSQFEWTIMFKNTQCNSLV